MNLETARLWFRALELGDEMIMYPEITEKLTEHWIQWEPSTSLEEERARVKQLLQAIKSGDLAFLAFSKESNEFVGFCGLETSHERAGEQEINVWVKEGAQGHGYGLEITHGFIEWLKKYLRESFVIYSVTKGNLASEKMARKLNFQPLRTWTSEKRGQMRTVTDYLVSLRVQ